MNITFTLRSVPFVPIPVGIKSAPRYLVRTEVYIRYSSMNCQVNGSTLLLPHRKRRYLVAIVRWIFLVQIGIRSGLLSAMYLYLWHQSGNIRKCDQCASHLSMLQSQSSPLEIFRDSGETVTERGIAANGKRGKKNCFQSKF